MGWEGSDSVGDQARWEIENDEDSTWPIQLVRHHFNNMTSSKVTFYFIIFVFLYKGSKVTDTDHFNLLTMENIFGPDSVYTFWARFLEQGGIHL